MIISESDTHEAAAPGVPPPPPAEGPPGELPAPPGPPVEVTAAARTISEAFLLLDMCIYTYAATPKQNIYIYRYENILSEEFHRDY